MALRTHQSSRGADRRQHPRDRPHLAAGQPAHRLPDPAQQGDRGGQRLRPRVRHPPARRADGADHLRAHGPGRAGLRRVADRARQALRPPRRGRRPPKLGFDLSREELDKAFARFKELADRKPRITDVDLEALVAGEVLADDAAWRFVGLQVAGGTVMSPTATVRQPRRRGGRAVGHRRRHGRRRLRAIAKATGVDAKLVEFHVSAVSGGTDALGDVTVQVEYEGSGNRARRGHRRGRGLGARLPPGRQQARPQHRREGSAGMTRRPKRRPIRGGARRHGPGLRRGRRGRAARSTAPEPPAEEAEGRAALGRVFGTEA